MARANKKKLSLEELLEQSIIKEEEKSYKIPNNWIWTKLDNIVSICTGKKDANYGCEDGIYPFFTCASEPIKCEGYSFDGESILLPGNGANVGVALYYNGKFEAYQRTYVIQSNNSINLKYVYYHFVGFWKDYNADKQYGSATNYIKLGNFQEYPIPIAPLVEQQRIVERIESLFEKLDAAKELAQDALESFEKRKAAILHKAFTGELTTKWREENKVNLDTWEEKKLKEICTISSGGTPSRKKPEYYTGNIPWIKTGEIRWNYIFDAEEKITQEAIDNSSAKLVEKGAVLVAMYGQGLTRGRAAILDTVAATNQAVCVLKVNENSFNKFIYYYFMYNYWKFREEAVGGNQPNLSGKIISDFQIKLPLLEEQHEIVTIIDYLLEKEQQAKELCDIIEKIDLMKKAILVRAFRGDLGTNNPEEESAIELLKEALKEKL